MQARGRGGALPPIGIAFEGDLGNRIDAVMAVAMLNGFSAKAEARRISLSVSRPSIKAAQLADVVTGFYGGRPVNGVSMVGMPESGPADDAPPVAAVLTKNGADGAPLYTSNIARVLDTADNAVLIRNMLLAQNDSNACIVLAGPATGLARLLGLFGSGPQIQTKVSRLVVALGSFPSGEAEASVKNDIAAARKLFAEWPTPLIAVGSEVGAAIPYPAASIERDFAWSPAHPVADAYRAFKTMPYDASSTALAAMLQAVKPDEGYFTLSEPGTISVLDDGRTQFTPTADGAHRYVIVDAAQRERVLQMYTSLVSAPPAPRPGRGGRGAPPAAAPQQQQKPPAEVPPVAPPTAKPPAP